METPQAVVNVHVCQKDMLITPPELSRSFEKFFNHKVGRASLASRAAIYNEDFHKLSKYVFWQIILQKAEGTQHSMFKIGRFSSREIDTGDYFHERKESWQMFWHNASFCCKSKSMNRINANSSCIVKSKRKSGATRVWTWGPTGYESYVILQATTNDKPTIRY